jgi:hypothetical protein
MEGSGSLQKILDRDLDPEGRFSRSQLTAIFGTGEGSSFLTFLKGDLIILEDSNTGETVQNSGGLTDYKNSF